MYLIISFFFELHKLGVNDNMWDFNFTNFFIFSDEKIIRGTVSGFGSMLGFETATRLKNGKKRTFWKMEIYQENLYTVMFRGGFTKAKHFLKSILSVWYGGIMLRPICFKRGEWVLITSLREGGIWKIKKVGGSMVQGWVFLKGGGWHFS